MIRQMQAALCAAIAICATTPVAAATYVTYTIGGTTTPEASAKPAWFIAEFTVPVSGFEPGNSYYFNTNNSVVGFGSTEINAYSTGLFFQQQGRVFSNSSLSFNACLTSPMASVPVTPMKVAVDASCSTADILISGVPAYNFTRATGKVDSLTISTSDTAPRGTGLSSFVLAVPEPSTWALMLAGFAMTGHALRRRRASVAYA